MTARHFDLTASAGETLNAGVRFHAVGDGVRLDALQAGEWVYYKGEPWPVFAVTVQPSGAVRVRLGRGSFWEPDREAAPDALAYLAPPATITAARVTYRRNDGTWGGLPFGLAASSTEIRVLPHDEASSGFTQELARIAETQGGPMSFEWQATATFVEVPGVRRLAEGALLIVPATVEVAPVPTLLEAR